MAPNIFLMSKKLMEVYCQYKAKSAPTFSQVLTCRWNGKKNSLLPQTHNFVQQATLQSAFWGPEEGRKPNKLLLTSDNITYLQISQIRRCLRSLVHMVPIWNCYTGLGALSNEEKACLRSEVNPQSPH